MSTSKGNECDLRFEASYAIMLLLFFLVSLGFLLTYLYGRYAEIYSEVSAITVFVLFSVFLIVIIKALYIAMFGFRKLLKLGKKGR